MPKYSRLANGIAPAVVSIHRGATGNWFSTIRPSHFPRKFSARGLALLLVLPTLTHAAAVAPVPVVAAPSAPLGPRVDAVFARWDKPHTPGLVLGIAQDGKTIYQRGYGMANLEHNIKMSPQIITESGSVAKQFTAAAVALLAVRGKLSLDDPVRKHLPEFPDFGQPITLRMLLNHTSGLRDIHGLFDLLGRPSYTTPHENREVLELVSRQRGLNFTPGTEYLYSNTGFILLTIVVERVTGQPFTAFCQENIFKPRGLQNTTWRAEFTKIVPRRAAGYETGPNGTFLIDSPYSNLYGNGGLLSTVGDWLTWNASLDSAAGEWLEVVKLLQAPSKLADGTPLTYGLGLIATQYRGLEEISHGGSTSGYRTFLARFPGKRVSIALLANSGDVNASDLVHRVADIVLGLPPVPPPVAIELTAPAIAGYAGLYRNRAQDALLYFSVEDGKLMHLGRTPLIALAAHTFVARGSSMTYTFDDPSSGQSSGLITKSGNTSTPFLPVAAAKPTAAQLADYAGNYYSEELGVTLPFEVRDGKLTVRLRPHPAMAAQPTFADGFAVPELGHFTFSRGNDGKVSGLAFTNNGGRCRRIKFEHR